MNFGICDGMTIDFADVRRMLIDGVRIIPGHNDGTPVGMLVIEDASLGALAWMMTPKMAQCVAELLNDYASSEMKPTKRSE